MFGTKFQKVQAKYQEAQAKAREVKADITDALDEANERAEERKAKFDATPLGKANAFLSGDTPEQKARKFDKGEKREAKRRAKRLHTGEVQFQLAVADGQVFDVKRHGRKPLGPLAGARATVETAGEITRRTTLTRTVALGPLAAIALKKKTGTRDIYLIVEGDGFCITREVHLGFMEDAARDFAATFNEAAAEAA